MKLAPDCLVCLLRTALGAARLSMAEQEVRTLLDRVLELQGLRGGNWQVTAPEVAKDVWMVLMSMTGETDPLGV